MTLRFKVWVGPTGQQGWKWRREKEQEVKGRRFSGDRSELGVRKGRSFLYACHNLFKQEFFKFQVMGDKRSGR